MKDKLIKNIIDCKGRLKTNYMSLLSNEDIKEIKEITNFSPDNTPINILIKFIINDITEYPICKICGKPVMLHNKKLRLLDVCSKECGYVNRVRLTKESNMIKYGTDSTNRLDSIKIKQQISLEKKYGYKSYTQTEEFKNKSKKTKLEKYGYEYFNNMTKNKNTKLELHGDENYNNHNKFIETCMDRYGVSHVMKNKDIFYKQQSCYGSNRYKHLYYRGSYELHFIKEYEKHFDINTLQNCFPIKYVYKNENKIYFPDFIISNKNKIIEIKSDWTYNNKGKNKELEEQNESKWAAAKKIEGHTITILKSKSEIDLFFTLFT